MIRISNSVFSTSIYRFLWGELNALPISPATAAQQKPVIALVEALYGLTAEEIAVMEGR